MSQNPRKPRGINNWRANRQPLKGSGSMIGAMNGRWVKLTFHMPDGDIEIDLSKVKCWPGMWGLNMPGGHHVPQYTFRMAPAEPGGPDCFYSGSWSAEFQESSIALAGPGIPV